ncbi:peptidylprolyl isomerase [Kistimonas asteriae]|uniref:peptidylprolyl isomerase n=1 Tax=Kistimonas asteriae TaxID=517724 RepID=UPI001BA9D8B5|nr:peptidylprolyl isomerase [Kistimonas asteriae]
MIRYAMTVIAMLLSTVVYSAIERDINDKNIAAIVGGEVITTVALDVFYQQAKPGDFRTTRESVLRDLIDNRLLAHWRESSGLVTEENPVGFSSDVAVADQLNGLVRQYWREPLERWIREQPGGIAGFIQEESIPSQNNLTDLMNNKSPVSFDATARQLEIFNQTILLTYRVPGRKTETITLRDIYDRQNVQGRIQLSRANPAYLAGQVEQLLGHRVVAYWAEAHTGLTTADLQSMKRVLIDRRERETVLKRLGLFNVMHSSNPVLRQLADAVSQQEVTAYYRNNKKQFSRLTAVKAFHIQLDSQKKADDVYAQLLEGLTFSEAVKQHSMADDRIGDEPGSLGWMARTDKAPDWLESMAFMQKPDIPSRPVRRPVKAGEPAVWEIILVTEQKKGFYREDSETVRYLASRQIALEKAKTQFAQLKERLRKDVPVHINPDYIGVF